jgi:hypothetical protein
MTIALDATVGGTAANTYASQAEADALADGIFPAPSAWLTASPDDKARALVTARKELDQEHFTGDRYTTTQACAWPRVRVYKPGGSGELWGLWGGASAMTFYLPTEIPDLVKQAQIVRAMALVALAAENDGALPVDDLAGVASFSVGSEVSMTLDPSIAAMTERGRHFATVIRPLLGPLVYAPQPRMVRG